MSDDSVYLQHIRDALADIAAYTGAGRDAFFAERMRQDATLRKLEIIGQAVKKLSDELGSQLGSGRCVHIVCLRRHLSDSGDLSVSIFL